MRKRPVIHVTMHVAFTTLEGGGGDLSIIFYSRRGGPFNHILLLKGGTLQSYSALEGGDTSIIFYSRRGGPFNHILLLKGGPFNHILLSKGGTLLSTHCRGGTLQSYSIYSRRRGPFYPHTAILLGLVTISQKINQTKINCETSLEV